MRRRLRITKRTPLWLVFVILVLAAAQQYGWFDRAKQAAVTYQPGTYQVSKFDDGDTIEINMNGTPEKIRFIGVDTPETHDPRKAVQCFGTSAASYTKQLIGNSAVRLEADPLNTNRDRYGRLLRYVYLPDGTLVNAEIIKQGYGFAYTGFPFTKSDDFTKLQAQARQSNIGLWSNCQPTQNQFGGFTSNDAN